MHDVGPAPAYPGSIHVAFGSVRVTSEGDLAPWFAFQVHGVVEAASWTQPLPMFQVLGTDAIIATAPQALPLQVDLTRSVGLSSDAQLRARVDRLNVRLGSEIASLTVGRQPLSLGYSALLPVLGLLTPVPVTALEREHVPGMDAVSLAVSPAAGMRIGAIYALGGDWQRDGRAGLSARRARAALTCETQLLGSQVLMMASLLREMPLAGLGLRRELDTWTVSTELAYARERPPLARERGFAMATVSATRRISARLTVTSEWAYYGFGSRTTTGYPEMFQWDRLLDSDLPFFFGRFHTGLSAQYRVASRARVEFAGLMSLQDGSSLLMPGLSVLDGDRATVMLSAWIPTGARPTRRMVPNSEYSLSSPSLGLEIRHHF